MVSLKRATPLFIGLILTVQAPCCQAESSKRWESNEPPPAPRGFSWRQFKQINARLLIPEGWFVKEEERSGTKVVFITKESIEKEGRLLTGFSVNVIQHLSEKGGGSPSQYAASAIANMDSVCDKVWGFQEPGKGTPFNGYAVFCKLTTPFGPIVQYNLFFGNDGADMLYVISFESPEASWDEAFKIGEPIVNNLLLDASF